MQQFLDDVDAEPDADAYRGPEVPAEIPDRVHEIIVSENADRRIQKGAKEVSFRVSLYGRWLAAGQEVILLVESGTIPAQVVTVGPTTNGEHQLTVRIP